MNQVVLSRRQVLMGTAAALSSTCPLPTLAQPGATAVVGIVRPYTGPLKGVAAGYVEAMKALFDSVNAQGGVTGTKIELLEKDDEGVPNNTEKQVRALVDDPQVVAVLGVAGTGNVLGAYPALEAGHLPLIGPFSGAPALRESKFRYIFHIRASYDHELEDIAEAIGERSPAGRVAVLYQDDTFGSGSFALFAGRLSTKAPKALPTGFRFDRTSGVLLDAAGAQNAVRQADAVLLIGAPKSVGSLLKMTRMENPRATAYTLSVVDALGLVKDVGAPVAQGLQITQVMPNPRKSALRLVQDYRSLMNATRQPLSYAGLEGYVAGRVLMEALSRVKGNPTRDKVFAALEEFGRVELGGLPISFSRKSHEGSRFVDLTMVSSSGSIID